MVKQETFTTRLLLLVYEAVLLPWTDITTAVPDAYYPSIKRQMRKAVADGLLEDVKIADMRKRFVTLTDAGTAHLEKLFGVELPRVSGVTKFSPTLPMKKQRRMVRSGECFPFLMGADIYVLQREKPRLEDLACAMLEASGVIRSASSVAAPRNEGFDDGDESYDDKSPTPVSDPWAPERPVIEGQADLDFLLNYGIFYTSAEVREYAKTQTFYGDMAGAVDVMGRSRYVGVIFKRNELYMVYNTRSNLMKWYEGVEEKTENAIRQMFSRYKGYDQHNTRNELGKLPAVVFGETMAMLPALVTGQKAGIDKRMKNNKYPRPYRQFNSQTNVFTEIYFVPAEKVGLEVLAHTITNGRVQRYNATRDFIEGFRPQIYLRSDALQPYGHSSDHFEFAYLPVFDIKFIRWLRERVERVMVATYKEASDGISKSLGAKIIGGFDFHVDDAGQHEKLDLKRYGNDGRLV